MNVVVSTFIWPIVHVSMGNISTTMKIREQHIGHVCEFLSRFYNAGETTKLKKCNFFTYTIDFQAHIVRPRR